MPQQPATAYNVYHHPFDAAAAAAPEHEPPPSTSGNLAASNAGLITALSPSLLGSSNHELALLAAHDQAAGSSSCYGRQYQLFSSRGLSSEDFPVSSYGHRLAATGSMSTSSNLGRRSDEDPTTIISGHHVAAVRGPAFVAFVGADQAGAHHDGSHENDDDQRGEENDGAELALPLATVVGRAQDDQCKPLAELAWPPVGINIHPARHRPVTGTPSIALLDHPSAGKGDGAAAANALQQAAMEVEILSTAHSLADHHQSRSSEVAEEPSHNHQHHHQQQQHHHHHHHHQQQQHADLAQLQRQQQMLRHFRPQQKSSSEGSVACKDCGNQAKKSCLHTRCRTCCKSRGFDCATHVKSTWVPAAKRRERQQAEIAAMVAGHHLPRSKRARTLVLQGAAAADMMVAAAAVATNISSSAAAATGRAATSSYTSPSTDTPPCSSDFLPEQDASKFRGALPSEFRAHAIFKCVKVTGVSDGQDEYAYTTVVKIGNHIFKGLLYDQGDINKMCSSVPATDHAVPAASSATHELQLGERSTPFSSAGQLMDLAGIYGTPAGSVLLGGKETSMSGPF